MSDIQPSERLKGEDEAAGDHAVAPRVTLPSIVEKIAKTEFIRVSEEGVDENGILTICVLKMQNGFFVTGQAAPASPENFDTAIGQQNAYDMAIRNAWQLEGYLLREELWRAEHELPLTDQASTEGY